MLVLGMASSHPPTLFAPVEAWSSIHGMLAGDAPDPKAAGETPEVLALSKKRIDEAFATLRQVLYDAHPDVLVIVGDDQREVFGPAFEPSLAVYVGSEVTGTTSMRVLGEPLSENHVTWRCDPDFAHNLGVELTENGFDPAMISELKPLGLPEGGLGHAFTRPANILGIRDADIRIVPVFLNAYYPPLPSARRCFDLGRAIRKIADQWSGRVAIMASGGLSHSFRPMASIDESLDRWILARISEGRAEDLTHLFTFASDTLVMGTGEIRNWIVVAGAFKEVPGTIVDYLPLQHAFTGVGFAYWRPGVAPSD